MVNIIILLFFYKIIYFVAKQPGPLMIQFKSDDIYARGYEIGYHLQYTIE